MTDVSNPPPPLGSVGVEPSPASPAGLVDVLLVQLDDVGVDKIGAYGATTADVRTPVLDGLAADGVLFRNAWGYTVCSPARSALQTGRHARRTGYGRNWFGGAAFVLPMEETTLPELLTHAPEADWGTSLAGKWHLGSNTSPLATVHPRAHGWGWYGGGLYATIGSYDRWIKMFDDGTSAVHEVYATTDTADDAIARLAAMSEPWLLEVAFNAAHDPLHLPPSHLHTYPSVNPEDPRQLHRAMVEAMDTELGRLLAALSPEVRQRTLVLVVGDNGDSVDLIEQAVPGARLQGKGTLADSGVRIPFLASGARVEARGVISDALVSLVDVWPTLAELADVDPSDLPGVHDPSGPLVVDGVSLLPVLADPLGVRTVHETLYTEKLTPLGFDAELTEDQRAIRDERYKVVVDAIRGTEALFEYRDDQVGEGDPLGEAQWTEEQRAARDRLVARMDELVAAMSEDR